MSETFHFFSCKQDGQMEIEAAAFILEFCNFLELVLVTQATSQYIFWI